MLTPVLLLLLPLVANTAWAQTSSIDVSDMVDKRFDAPSALWIPDAFGMEEQQWARFLGEGSFVPATGKDGFPEESPSGMPYDANDLAAAVASLAGLRVSDVRVESGILTHPEDQEDEVRAAVECLRSMRRDLEYEVLLERISENGSEVLLEATTTAAADRTAVISDTTSTSRVADYDVEIAQGAAIANPVVVDHFSGAGVAIRAVPIGTGAKAVVQTIVRVSEAGEDETIALETPSMGDLDRLNADIAETVSTTLVEPGARSTRTWTDQNGDRLRLTTSARWPRVSERWRPRLSWVGPLTGSLHRFHLSQKHLATARGRGHDVRSTRRLTSRIEQRRSAETRSHIDLPGGLRILPDDGASAFATNLEGDLSEMLAPVALRIRILVVDRGTVEDPFAETLPQGATVLADHDGWTSLTSNACVASSSLRSYIRDWDCEVAQSSRIPDPKIGTVRSGYAFESRTTRSDQGLRMDLLCELQSLIGIEARKFVIGVESTAPATASGSSIQPAMVLPQQTVRIERPVRRITRLDLGLTLGEDDTAVVRRSVRSFTGPGKELVVGVRARVD